jgi:hypothetical protein
VGHRRSLKVGFRTPVATLSARMIALTLRPPDAGLRLGDIPIA